jgi:hypothetical protein
MKLFLEPRSFARSSESSAKRRLHQSSVYQNTLYRAALLNVLLLAVLFRADAITYYVSPNGSDKASGTSPQQPWKSINKVNSTALWPGDTVLFKGQSRFNGQIDLAPGVNGTATAPITLGSYVPSSGAALSASTPSTERATVSGGTGGALLAYNNGGFEIRALNFSGSGATKNTADGITFYNDLAGNVVKEHISLDGVEVSGFGGWGISLGAYNNRSGFRDVRVTNAASHDNLRGGLVIYGPPFDTTQKNYVNAGVYVAWVKAYSNIGDPSSTANTGNGIVLGSVNGATIERCVAHDNGINNKSAEGPVGIWSFDATAVIIQHNESYHNRTGSDADGDGFDLDNNVTNSVLQYNYAHDFFQRNNYFNASGAVRITWGTTTYTSASIADWLASTTQERFHEKAVKNF